MIRKVHLNIISIAAALSLSVGAYANEGGSSGTLSGRCGEFFKSAKAAVQNVRNASKSEVSPLAAGKQSQPIKTPSDLLNQYMGVIFPGGRDVKLRVPSNPMMPRLLLANLAPNEGSVSVSRALQIAMKDARERELAEIEKLQSDIERMKIRMKSHSNQTEQERFIEQISSEVNPDEGFKKWTNILERSIRARLGATEESLNVDILTFGLNVRLAELVLTGQLNPSVDPALMAALRETFMTAARQSVSPISADTLNKLGTLGDAKVNSILEDLGEASQNLRSQLTLVGRLKPVAGEAYDLLKSRARPDGSRNVPSDDPMNLTIPKDQGELYPMVYELVLSVMQEQGKFWYWTLREQLPAPQDPAGFKKFMEAWGEEMPSIVYMMGERLARNAEDPHFTNLETKRGELQFLREIQEERLMARGTSALERLLNKAIEWVGTLTDASLKWVVKGAKAILFWNKFWAETTTQASQGADAAVGVVRALPESIGHYFTSRYIRYPWLPDDKQLPLEWPVELAGASSSGSNPVPIPWVGQTSSGPGGNSGWGDDPFSASGGSSGVSGGGTPPIIDPNAPTDPVNSAGTDPVNGSGSTGTGGTAAPIPPTANPFPANDWQFGTTYASTLDQQGYRGYHNARAFYIMMSVMHELDMRAAVLNREELRLQLEHAQDPSLNQADALRKLDMDRKELLQICAKFLKGFENAMISHNHSTADAAATFAFNVAGAPSLHGMIVRGIGKEIKALAPIVVWLQVLAWKTESVRPDSIIAQAQRGKTSSQALFHSDLRDPSAIKKERFMRRVKMAAITLGIATTIGSVGYFRSQAGQPAWQNIVQGFDQFSDYVFSPKNPHPNPDPPPIPEPDLGN